jgi:hypothetical protein
MNLRTLQRPHPVNAGNSVELIPTQGFVTLLKVDGDLTTPQTLTAHVFTSIVPGTAVPIFTSEIALLARLEWGVGGAALAADFDPLQGETLTVSATFFHLKVSYPAPFQTNHPNMRATGVLSYGTRGGPTDLTRSIRIPSVIPGDASSPITIPPWSTDVRLLSTEPAQYGSYLLTAQGLAGDTLYRSFPSDAADRLPIAPNSHFLMVGNTGAVASSFVATFSLSFG